jgi:hypothetical protein
MSADRNAVQLGLLADLLGVLDQAQIRSWLRGGWGLDFHLGRVTKVHDDLDLVTWRRHRDRIGRLLEDRGFERVATGYPESELKLLKSGEDVTFALVLRNHEGALVTPGFEWWPWPAEPFAPQPRTLEGVTARVLTATALLEEKEGYLRYRGRPLRPKDKVSIGLLRDLVARNRR